MVIFLKYPQRDSKGDEWTMFWLALSIRDKELCDEAWKRMYQNEQAQISNVLDAVKVLHSYLLCNRFVI